VNNAAPIADVPDLTSSALRMGGALLIVISLLFVGVWLYKNWQRLAVRRGTAPKLSILEVKSLGQRQAIYVVGYQQQRMLLASSPAGVTLVSHLPEAEAEEQAAAAPSLTFAEAFQHVLARKQP